MRPYLAVLKDAFREAFASFLLWLALILVAITLGLLACFSLTDTLASDLAMRDVRNPQQLLQRLTEAGTAEKTSPAGRLWQSIPEKERTRIQELATDSASRPGRAAALQQMLLRELNALLPRKDLFDAEVWQPDSLPDEAQRYLKRGVAVLSQDELKRLNRLLIDAALPYQIEPAGDSQAKFLFLGWEVPSVAGIPPRRMVGDLLVLGLRFVVGMGGLIVAILVTSTTIPQMFEPGSIDLVLSKPVSRVLLFLTRFVGGCAFVLVIAAPLIIGVWGLAGLRLGLWYPNLFWCIPLFVFLFMVYYTISALSGVIWKNAIVSVILTAVFMLVCMIVETYYSAVALLAFDHIRLQHLVMADKTLIGLERNGTAYAWSETTGKWNPIFKTLESNPGMDAVMNYPYAGPVYDAKQDRLAAVYSRGGFGQYGGSGTLVVGERAEGWHTIDSISSPFGLSSLFATKDGDLIAVGTSGVSQLKGDLRVRPATPFKVLGFDLSQMKKPENEAPRWEPIGPDRTWTAPFAAGMDSQGRLAIVSRGTVVILKRADGESYSVEIERDLKTNESNLVAVGGSTVAIVFNQGDVEILDAKTLATRHKLKAFTEEKPKQIAVSDDGQWVFVVTHDKSLWACDAQSGNVVSLPIYGQGDVSAIALYDGKLAVASFYRRVNEYEVGTWKTGKAYDPPLSTWERINVYGIFRAYAIMPKPGQMSEDLATYLVSETRSETLGRDDDLSATRITRNPWRALWSNLAFVGVMLTLGSLYVWRKDF